MILYIKTQASLKYSHVRNPWWKSFSESRPRRII